MFSHIAKRILWYIFYDSFIFSTGNAMNFSLTPPPSNPGYLLMHSSFVSNMELNSFDVATSRGRHELAKDDVYTTLVSLVTQ